MATVGVVTVVEGKEDLHEVIPDGIFWNESIMSLGLLYDGGEVTATAKFHKDIENARIAVDVSVMIAYNVFVMEVFEDVAGERWVGCG